MLTHVNLFHKLFHHSSFFFFFFSFFFFKTKFLCCINFKYILKWCKNKNVLVFASLVSQCQGRSQGGGERGHLPPLTPPKKSLRYFCSLPLKKKKKKTPFRETNPDTNLTKEKQSPSRIKGFKACDFSPTSLFF